MIRAAKAFPICFSRSGKPPIVEEHGVLEEFPIETPDRRAGRDADRTNRGPSDGWRRAPEERIWRDYGSCDCSYALADLARFRVKFSSRTAGKRSSCANCRPKSRRSNSSGCRRFSSEMVKEKNGIIFVTGATGSGKTTTLAAMLNELNRTQQIHIVTLEDPIEFLHPHKQSALQPARARQGFSRFRHRPARRSAPGAESHSGRRNSRPRHDGNRDDRVGDRPHRFHHDAHDQCRPDDQPHPRHVQQGRGAAAAAAAGGNAFATS